MDTAAGPNLPSKVGLAVVWLPFRPCVVPFVPLHCCNLGAHLVHKLAFVQEYFVSSCRLVASCWSAGLLGQIVECLLRSTGKILLVDRLEWAHS